MSERGGMVGRALLACALVSAIITPGRAAAEVEPPPEPEVDEASSRIEQLEQHLDEVEGQLEQMTRGASEAGADVRVLEQRLARQDQRLARQDQRIIDLERQTQEANLRAEEAADQRRIEWTRAAGVLWRPTGDDALVIGFRGFLWARWDGLMTLEGDQTTYLSSFSIPETRLRFTATFAEGLFHMAIEPSLTLGRPGIQDGYLELRLHPAAQIRVGQMLVPFDWESNTSPPRLPLNGLGPLAGQFGHGRDLGLMVLGTAAQRFHYRVGVFNGAGRGNPNDNYHLMVAAMARYQILGTVNGGWGWSDLGHSPDPNLAVRLGFSWDRDERRREVNDAAFTLASYQVTADLLFRFRGISVAGVYYYRGANAEDIDAWTHSQGFLVHAGYMIWREHLELLFRATSIDLDLDVQGPVGYQLDAGLTFFLIGHHARLTALYKFMREMPGMPEGARAHAIQIEARGWF